MGHAQRNMTHHMGVCGIRGMHSRSNGRVGYHGARTMKHDASHGRVWYQRNAQPVKLESGVSWGTHSLSNGRVGYHGACTTKHGQLLASKCCLIFLQNDYAL